MTWEPGNFFFFFFLVLENFYAGGWGERSNSGRVMSCCGPPFPAFQLRRMGALVHAQRVPSQPRDSNLWSAMWFPTLQGTLLLLCHSGWANPRMSKSRSYSLLWQVSSVDTAALDQGSLGLIRLYGAGLLVFFREEQVLGICGHLGDRFLGVPSASECPDYLGSSSLLDCPLVGEEIWRTSRIPAGGLSPFSLPAPN